VLHLDAGNANAYFNRGSTHDSLGEYDKAIADYTRALEMDGSTDKGGAPPVTSPPR
jgi:tetratricopeptide (TPR) repeat protein